MAKGTCPIIDPAGACAAPIRTRGMCNKHYLRLRRHGDPVTRLIRDPTAPFAEWFWLNVAPPTARGCREWMKARQPSGYGIVAKPGHRFCTAHRVAWELTYGPFPDGVIRGMPGLGLQIRHYICANPPCCNPAHFVLGSIAQNIADKKRVI